MESVFATEVPPADFSDEPLAQISAAMDEFEGYTHAHGKRIAVIADAIAEKFNFASHDRQALRQAALVHDIGELVMNREYIKSNRLLREEERIDMQRRIRDVIQAPDGAILAITDEQNGALLRVTPAGGQERR